MSIRNQKLGLWCAGSAAFVTALVAGAAMQGVMIPVLRLVLLPGALFAWTALGDDPASAYQASVYVLLVSVVCNTLVAYLAGRLIAAATRRRAG